MKKDKNHEANHKMTTKKKLLILVISLIILAGAAATVFLLINNDNLPVAQDTTPTPTPKELPDEPVTPGAVTPGTVIPDPSTVTGFETEKPFELVAEKSDETGTATDSSYRILLDKIEYTTDQLAGMISIIPETKFTIEKKSNSEYLLKPADLLGPNRLYSFLFNDEEKGISYSWVFQTRAEFFVTYTFPRDRATYVPVNIEIEITFSRKVEKDLYSYFEISPKTSGQFEINKNTVVFTPNTPLSYDTVYTVTVKKGFSQINGLSLKEDMVFSFQTEPEHKEKSMDYKNKHIEFTRKIYNFYPSELPLISVRTNNFNKNDEIEFCLYRYSDEQEFKEDLFVKDDRSYWSDNYKNQIDCSGMEEILRIKTTLLYDYDNSNEGYPDIKYIELPETLPEGHYAAVVRYKDMECKAPVQINSMAVYIGTAINKTIGFIYDSQTSTPVEGAEIVFDKFSMKTGADGIAVSDTLLIEKEGSTYKNYTIKREGHPSYYNIFGSFHYSYYDKYGHPHDIGSSWIGDIKFKYWGYLYTDRHMYLRSDTINLWGMLASKDGSEVPRKVTVRLAKSPDYSPYKYTIIDEKKAYLNDMNIIKSSIAYENLSTGYYVLEVFNGDELLLGKNIYISEHIKPTYSINTSVDKKIAAYGEKIRFELDTKLSYESPVNGMEFKYYINGLSIPDSVGTLTTDATGRSSLDIDAIPDSDSWRPKEVSINIRGNNPEERNIGTYEYLTVFPRDVMVNVMNRSEDMENFNVTIETNKIDISKIPNMGVYNVEDYKGEPVDIDIEIELYETYYISEQIGTYYDFINKKTQPKSKYYKHEKKIQTINTRTAEGKYSFNFTREKDKGYHIVVKCNDSQGRPIQEVQNLYILYSYNDRLWWPVDSYYLKKDREHNKGYVTGEEVKVCLACKGNPCVKTENTKVLYMLFKNGMMEYTLSDDPAHSFTFNKEYIPGVGLMAVYFDGKNMNLTSMQVIDYDEEEKRLDLEVTADAKEYYPGDTAVFNIKVSDPKGNGRKAEVLFSIVDEAYFANWDQKVKILEDIYAQATHTGYLHGDTPHTNTLEDYDGYLGESGEGGDVYREIVHYSCKDTALFESVITDDEGKAQISVKLPFGQAKWRVSFIGLTDDPYAGNGSINIDTRFPYYVNPVLNDCYISGDEPFIQIHSFGAVATKGDKVDYTVAVKKDGQDLKNYYISSTIGERALVRLDPLEQGSYTCTVTGKYKNYKSSVTMPFEVLQGFAELSETEYFKLSEGMKFSNVNRPVKVYFFNENVKSYWMTLLDLAYSSGKRIDSIIARKHTKKLLQDYFGEEYMVNSKDYDLFKYQLSNGGIALHPDEKTNPVLTAKICSLKDSSFDYEQVKEYFYDTLTYRNSESTGIAASYWGLACLGEPIIPEIFSLPQSADFKPADKLYIGLAFADAGDMDRATKIYREIVDLYMKEDLHGAYIDFDNKGKDSEYSKEAAALCALLSQKINAPEKQKFFEYVNTMYARDILTSAVRIAYIQNSINNLDSKSSFIYELDGKREHVTIDGKNAFSMFLPANKLPEIRFSDVEGRIVAAAVYKSPICETSETDSRISITRTYSGKDGTAGTTFDASDYIKVTLKIRFDKSAPVGFYMVEDYLPASFKNVSERQKVDMWAMENETNWHLHDVGGQRVSFLVHHNYLNTTETTIEYYVRAVNTGKFTADSAVISNLDSNITNYAPRATIEVK
ncbi:MAG: Ig-like domain-containing protein [Ruminiclostridium sp.]|jgi:hypothetical protein|nr:Ig-like domain-containing protein [Ruminiclostridium sp.]